MNKIFIFVIVFIAAARCKEPSKECLNKIQHELLQCEKLNNETEIKKINKEINDEILHTSDSDAAKIKKLLENRKKAECCGFYHAKPCVTKAFKQCNEQDYKIFEENEKKAEEYYKNVCTAVDCQTREVSKACLKNIEHELVQCEKFVNETGYKNITKQITDELRLSDPNPAKIEKLLKERKKVQCCGFYQAKPCALKAFKHCSEIDYEISEENFKKAENYFKNVCTEKSCEKF